MYIYTYWGFYLFIIIKKRKGRLIKHVPFENCTGFFLILEFYDFLQLSERGSNEKQVAKKEKRTVPTLSGWAIQTTLSLPTYLSFAYPLSLYFSTFSCMYIYTYLYLHPLVFTKEEVLKWWGYFTRFLFSSTLSLPSYIKIYFYSFL